MGAAFPEAVTLEQFRSARSDAELLAGVAAVCDRHGVPGVAIVRFAEGSLPVYALGDALVLKLYPPVFRHELETEAPVLELLHGRLCVPTPRVVAIGERDGWGYVLMSRLRGESLAKAWPRISSQGRDRLAAQLGAAIAELHAVRSPALEAIAPDWNDFTRTQRAGCVERQRAHGLDPHWLAQIPAFLDATVVAPRRTALLHTEIMREHLLVVRTAPPFGGAAGRAQVPAVDGTAPPFGGAAGRAQVPAVDGTAPPFGGAAGRAQVPAVDGTAPPFGGAAGRAQVPAVDGTAPPFGGAAGRAQVPAVDGTAPPFGGAAGRAQVPAVDGTAPPFGGAAGRAQVPAVDGTAPPFGGAAGRAQVPAVDGTAPPFGGAAGRAQVPAVDGTSDDFARSGLFDFEPAMYGDPEYDLASVGIFVSCGDAGILRRIALAYGYAASELDERWSRRMLAYALLHRYSNLRWYLERLPPPAAPTLDALALCGWGV